MGLAIYGKFDRLLLEVEVAPTKKKEFEQKYAKLSGESAIVGDHYQIQDNKWGVEYRIYFDSDPMVVDSLKTLEYYIEERDGGGYRSDFSYRINNERLFWKLIQHGYRLGLNGPIA